MLLLTLRGTPTLYYGDELGMHDVPIPRERVQDPWEKGVPGLGLGRDPERTPMQWGAEPHAGFTSGTPWLPLAEDFTSVNVAAERAEPTSMLAFYRSLIDLRRSEPALGIGSYEPVDAAGPILAYLRRHGERRLLIALNFNPEPAMLEVPTEGGRILLSTHLDRAGPLATGGLGLRGDEGVIVELPPT
jgi:alpha-glucosidase